MPTEWQYMEKPWGFYGKWHASEGPSAKNNCGLQPLGFWPPFGMIPPRLFQIMSQCSGRVCIDQKYLIFLSARSTNCSVTSYLLSVLVRKAQIYRWKRKQGSSENDGRSDVYDQSLRSFLTAVTANCRIYLNLHEFTWIYLNLPKFT